MNRRTSNYTLHLPDAIPADLDHLTEALDQAGHPVNDRQTTGLTFRATDDEDAARVSARAMDAAGFADDVEAHLTTGLGIHRRTVVAV